MLMADPIKQACHTEYRATRTSGVRNPKTTVKWIVLHDTEGGTAKSVAREFAKQSAIGSAHIIVDDNECQRVLDNKDIPWGASGANTNGFHIEQCGWAYWTRAQWLSHDVMLHRSAYKAAIHMDIWGIPARWVGPWGLRLGLKGLTTHADITKWKNTYGGHTDPGAGFPKDVYLRYVKEYLAEL